MKISSAHLAQVLLEATDEATEVETKKAVKQFGTYLKRKRLTKQLPQILGAYRKLYDQKHSIVEAEVRSQSRMSEATKTSLRSALKKRYGVKEAHILELLDERLIAGFKIQVGDEVYDGSVKGRLEALRRELVA